VSLDPSPEKKDSKWKISTPQNGHIPETGQIVKTAINQSLSQIIEVHMLNKISQKEILSNQPFLQMISKETEQLRL
jgi:hypothetical protein